MITLGAMSGKHWIILSPHLDDAALSCGGWLWDLAQAGAQVQVWTICAGDPPPGEVSAFARSLEARWGTGARSQAARRREDEESCRILGTGWRHFNLPDCIYRRIPGEALRFPYDHEAALFGELHPAEAGLIAQLADELAAALPAGAELICPLTLGGHVDHRLTRRAAGQLERPVWYYADYPYVLTQATQIAQLTDPGWEQQVMPVTASGLRAWQASVAAHASQISTFWADQAAMHAAIAEYCAASGGVRLWHAD